MTDMNPNPGQDVERNTERDVAVLEIAARVMTSNLVGDKTYGDFLDDAEKLMTEWENRYGGYPTTEPFMSLDQILGSLPDMDELHEQFPGAPGLHVCESTPDPEDPDFPADGSGDSSQ